jgi:hypothetical protein
MFFAHILGGVVSYQLITHFDRIWSDIFDLLASLFPKVAKGFVLHVSELALPVTEFPVKSFNFSHEDFSRRGPPCN